MVSVESFKLGMRRLVAGVCVIATTSEEGARTGATATAVCSVCASPPTLLSCLNQSSATYAAICRNKLFSVNVLSLLDRAIADRFAGRHSPAEKFAAGVWSQGKTGAPVLTSALASFDCRLADAVTAGSHGVMFGEVMDVLVRETDAEPLLYADGGYGWFSNPASELRLEDAAVRLRKLFAFPATEHEWR